VVFNELYCSSPPHVILVTRLLQTASMAICLGLLVPGLVRTLQFNGTALLGTINVSSGVLTPAGELALPALSTPQCRWDISPPTTGRTSASFHQNGTWFFLAQEACPGSPTGRTALMSFYGPFAERANQTRAAAPYQARATATFDPTAMGHLGEWSIAWDFVCNVIVAMPHVATNASGQVERTTRLLMVSEYDGEVRPQAEVPLATGWIKVDGLGALDTHGHASGGPREWNCGDDCAVYWLEERVNEGDAAAYPEQKSSATPRRIVGREFHSGRVVSNVSDRFALQTMTFTELGWADGILYDDASESPVNIFVGVGRCGNEAWQDAACRAAPGALSLAGIPGGGREPYLLALLNGGAAASPADAADTIRLGVLIERERADESDGVVARVVENGAIATYQLKMPEEPEGTWSATLAATSPVLQVMPLLWSTKLF
jgi:hypothetical protein